MKIVVSDLEGTLTTGATWRGFGDYLKRHRSALAYNLFFLSRLPTYPLMRLGLVDEQHAKFNWIKDQIRLFAGATPAEVDDMAKWVVERKMWPQRRHALLSELEAHRLAGARIIIVTGTYQPIAEKFASRINADAIGTPLAFEGDRLVGLAEAHKGLQDKGQKIREIVGEATVVAAYGDTEGDIPMLRLSGAPTAVFPNTALRQEAQSRGWRIIDE